MTAMQELLRFVTSAEFDSLYNGVKEARFQYYLDKEKKQIEDAFNRGDLITTEDNYNYSNANEYYKYTYGEVYIYPRHRG